MSLEHLDFTPETANEKPAGLELGAFQNPIFSEPHDLMPKIRFEVDEADSTNTAHEERATQGEAVFHLITSSDTDATQTEHTSASTFQNLSFDVDISSFTRDTGSAEYSGPSPLELTMKIREDTWSLTLAKERLDTAIQTGTGVMAAMRVVESAQEILDAHMKQYNEAIAFHAPDASGITIHLSAQEGEISNE